MRVAAMMGTQMMCIHWFLGQEEVHWVVVVTAVRNKGLSELRKLWHQ